MSITNINELKEQINIVDIINYYVTLTKSGNNLKACCPFHKENTPSFIVNEQRQFFKCFGCGKSGDVFTFVQEIENVDFSDAIKIIASKSGLVVSIDQTNQINSNIKTIKEINLHAGRYYYKNLLKNTKALQYIKDRKISPETVKVFGLGYADNSDNLLKELQIKFSEHQLIESGIIVKSNNRLRLVFRDRIMFPIFNIRDEIIGFGGRQLGAYGPKYINSKETAAYSKKKNLYALNIAKKNLHSGLIFLVEGYIDAISMHQNGYKNTVATLGTALTIEQAQLISNYVNTVFVIYDSDQAGIQATLKALNIFMDAGIDARAVNLGSFKDPDEFFKNNDIKNFEELISNSQNILMYNLSQLESRFDLSNSMGLDSFIKEAVDYIKHYGQHKFSRQTYIEDAIIYLSNKTGYSIKSIGVDIFGQYFSPKQFAKQQNENSVLEIELENNLTEIDKKEKIILNAIMLDKLSVDDINIEDFSNRANKLTYYEITHSHKSTFNIEKNEVLSDAEYKLLIKNIKNYSLDRRVAFLENIQAKYLSLNTTKDMQIALILGNHIIKLKKTKS